MTYDCKTGVRVVVLPPMIERGAAVVQRYAVPSPKRAQARTLGRDGRHSGGGSAQRSRAVAYEGPSGRGGCSQEYVLRSLTLVHRASNSGFDPAPAATVRSMNR
jgi:hypothetical protein